MYALITLRVKYVFNKILIISYIEKISLKRRFKFAKISFVTYIVRQFVSYWWSCRFKGASLVRNFPADVPDVVYM